MQLSRWFRVASKEAIIIRGIGEDFDEIPRAEMAIARVMMTGRRLGPECSPV